MNVTQNPATLVDVVLGVNDVSSVKFKGDELYFTRLNNNAIWKIDIFDQNPIPVTVATGVAGASALAFLNDELYIAERATNRISKISVPLSVQNRNFDLQLFPNPAISTLTVSGIENGVLSLFSIAGLRVFHQPISAHSPVHFDLPAGIYMAKIESQGASVMKKLIIK